MESGNFGGRPRRSWISYVAFPQWGVDGGPIGSSEEQVAERAV